MMNTIAKVVYLFYFLFSMIYFSVYLLSSTSLFESFTNNTLKLNHKVFQYHFSHILIFYPYLLFLLKTVFVSVLCVDLVEYRISLINKKEISLYESNSKNIL
jgi:hypothetical protein